MTDTLKQRIEHLINSRNEAIKDDNWKPNSFYGYITSHDFDEAISIIEALQQRVKEREKTIGDAYMNITCGKTSEAECTLRGDIISRIPQYMAENKE